jgi:hypothetical protein
VPDGGWRAGPVADYGSLGERFSPNEPLSATNADCGSLGDRLSPNEQVAFATAVLLAGAAPAMVRPGELSVRHRVSGELPAYPCSAA